LAGLGVTDPDLDLILEGPLKDPSCGGNPVKMTAENTKIPIESLF